MEQFTIIEYIKKYKPTNSKGRILSRQGVLWRINNNLHLPNIQSIKMIGKSYILNCTK